MDDEETVGDELMRRIGPALMGAGLGMLIAGPPGAVLSGVAPTLLEMFIARFAVGRRKADLLFEVVEDLTGLTPQDVDAWAKTSEQRLDFACHAVQAALDALSERKVRALARVLAQGVQDDVWLDHGRIIIDALRELEEPHIQVLQAMIEHVPPATKDNMGPGAWSRRQLQINLPGFAQSILPIGSVLVRAGMLVAGLAAGNDEEGFNPAWTVTNFGRSCYEFLRTFVKQVTPAPNDHHG